MKLRVISLLSSVVWGGLGYWFVTDTGLRGGAWVALGVSPLIGLLSGSLAMRGQRFGTTGRCLVALLNLYVAVALFACAVGLWDITIGWGELTRLRTSGRLVAFGSTVAALLFGVTIMGWIFWPLSIVNHYLLWVRIDPQPPSGLRLRA